MPPPRSGRGPGRSARDILAGVNTPGTARLRALRLAKDAMDRDWAEPGLDLEAVAAHAGYARHHFVRAFKAAYGETPGHYLSRRRTERAEELLRCADLSVTEICGLVGFSSLGTFSARFKRHTGMSPSDYRTRHARRAGAMIPGCYAMLFAGGFPGRPASEHPASGSGAQESNQEEAPRPVPGQSGGTRTRHEGA